jgi:hypothetical protein
MTEAERKAMEWLDEMASSVASDRHWTAEYSRTLKAMLARPVLPAIPPADAFEAMRAQVPGHGAATTQFIYQALHDALTAPKTREVEVWHVEYTVWACENGWQPRIEVCGDGVIAEARALKMRELNGKSCIRVTGPHKQTVPA